MYRYEWSTEKWDELPPCPYYNSTLVIISGALTAVGGYDKGFFFHAHTNKLLTLQQRRWVEQLPTMKTARSNSAVVCTSDGEWVFVIGGSGNHGTTTVELFQVRRRMWYELTGLPRPLTGPSATICDNHLHVIGEDCYGFSCSIQSLPSGDEPTTSQSKPTVMWTSLPPLPVTLSTAATLCGQLVIAGGTQGCKSDTNSIHQLVDGQWVEIGCLSSERRWCLIVSQSPNKVLIVGGRSGFGRGVQVTTDSVEECGVVQQ